MEDKPFTAQLGFQFQPSQPYDLDYFISHSGVVHAVEQFELALAELQASPGAFRSMFVFGRKGAGKRHLCVGYQLKAINAGLSVELFDLTEEVEPSSDLLAQRFNAAYEQRKAEGGLLIAFAEAHPELFTTNPHLQSRLLAGASLELNYPREEELRPLLLSLSERHNLKLSERTMGYLERRIPLDPLSFEDIFDKVSQLSLSEGKPAGMALVRRVLEVGAEVKPSDVSCEGSAERESVDSGH